MRENRLAKAKELANLLEVCILYQSCVVEISLTLFALLCQNVAVVSVFPFDFPCAGERKTLL